MNLKHLLFSAAIPGMAIVLASAASAQVTISDAQTEPVRTSTANGGSADDVTITADGSIEVTSGTAVTIDSDNTVENSGAITVDNADDATAVELVGGNTGGFTHSGSISVTEDFTPEDTDNDGTIDGAFAQGSGRTGILISGASPFTGDLVTSGASTITVEGNDSFGIRLMENAGLAGNMNIGGGISVVGDNARGISVEDQVIGNLAVSGPISTRGENASSISITGDIDGQFSNSGTLSNTGYRFTQRPNLNGRNLLDTEDLLQAGAVIAVHGNVSQGVHLDEIISVSEAEDGTVTETVQSRSNISQFGGAPAVLIDGLGTPIAIGMVASITDPTDENFDADELYAFVNRGSVTASGLYNDVNATALMVQDAELEGGINNLVTLQANTFRSGNDGTDDVAGSTGAAHVIVLGSGAIVDEINNSGLILAQANEAADEIYADADNIIPPRYIQAVGLDIAEDASLSRLINSGNFTVLVNGREGEAVAIRDASGTLTYIENSGNLGSAAINSDPIGEQELDFDLIAIDVSANTTGVTINQVAAIDDDTTDDTTPPDPAIIGDIYLGSGDDVINIEAGTVASNVSFGAGADRLSLSGGSTLVGDISDPDGLASISVTGGSTLSQTAALPIEVGQASFDGTSTFRPTLDGATGIASTLVSSGDITFADGATITPILQNVVNEGSTTFEVLNAGGNLTLGGSLDSLNGLESPFLYDTSFALDPNNSNALVITLDLRSTDALGLDPVQAAGFNSAFDALQNNTDLANAFVNITDGSEFNQAVNQLLPEFAAASRQFVLANVDGAVGAVGTHLDNTRRSQAKPGGVWIQEFAYFADRDLAGLSEQYRGYGFGITGGIDTALGPFHTVGLNLGFASTEIEDVVGFDEPMDVLTLQLGAYAGFESGNLGVEAYAGGGFNDFEQNRVISIGNFEDQANGNWSGTHYNASVRAGYDLDVGKRYWLRPTVSLDYLSLTEEAYQESGALGIALDVDERTSELGGATAMLNLGAKWGGDRTWVRPSLRVGYRNEFINDGIVTNYGYLGLTERSTLESAVFPKDGFLLGFSVAAGSNYSSFAFDFDSDIRDGFIRHTGRLIVRLIF